VAAGRHGCQPGRQGEDARRAVGEGLTHVDLVAAVDGEVRHALVPLQVGGAEIGRRGDGDPESAQLLRRGERPAAARGRGELRAGRQDDVQVRVVGDVLEGEAARVGVQAALHDLAAARANQLDRVTWQGRFAGVLAAVAVDVTE